MVLEKKVSIWVRADIKGYELAILRDLYRGNHVDEITHKYKLEFSPIDETIEDIDNHLESDPTIEMINPVTGVTFYTNGNGAYRPDYILKKSKEADIEIQNIINNCGQCPFEAHKQCPCDEGIIDGESCELIFCERFGVDDVEFEEDED